MTPTTRMTATESLDEAIANAAVPITGEALIAALAEAGFTIVPDSGEVRSRVGYALYDHLAHRMSFHEIEEATNAVMRQLAMCGMRSS